MDDKENAVSPAIEFVGFWRRAGMHLLDILIFAIPAIIMYRVSLNLSMKIGAVYPFIVYWGIFYAFYIIMIVKFGGTPGKLISKARIVDRDGNYLNIVKAIIRNLINFLYAVTLILILWEAIHMKINPQDAAHYLNSSTGIFAGIKNLLGLVIWIDSLIIVLNMRKRALHDILAGSYVVSLSTCQYLQDNSLSVNKLPISNQQQTNKGTAKILAWILIVLTSFLMLAGIIRFLAAAIS